MKLCLGDVEQVLTFEDGYINELVIENKNLFYTLVNSIMTQAEGMHGDCVLSISDKLVQFSKYVDVTVQFAPFELNRKSLLLKLYNAMEKKTVDAENFEKAGELLGNLERYMLEIADDFPFDIHCQKLAIGPVIRAISPEIDDDDKSPLEKVFAYMELVRELDSDKLFVMVNMRSYFSDEEMQEFVNSASLHGYKVLLLGSVSETKLKNTKRYTVDADLCEF